MSEITQRAPARHHSPTVHRRPGAALAGLRRPAAARRDVLRLGRAGCHRPDRGQRHPRVDPRRAPRSRLPLPLMATVRNFLVRGLLAGLIAGVVRVRRRVRRSRALDRRCDRHRGDHRPHSRGAEGRAGGRNRGAAVAAVHPRTADRDCGGRHHARWSRRRAECTCPGPFRGLGRTRQHVAGHRCRVRQRVRGAIRGVPTQPACRRRMRRPSGSGPRCTSPRWPSRSWPL